MRNLKKLFAVLLTVAMIASMMVPALAGSYEGEGTKLQQIGLVAGDTPEQLDLDREMKRIEAVAFVIRAAGKEKEALSMTDEEVAEILAGWKDANEFPNWPNDNARKYGAYAIKAGIVVGMSSTEKIFAPNSLVKGIDFLVLLLKSALGYSKVNVNPDSENYVVEVAIVSGILQAGQVVTYASKTALIRDDAIHILYSAVMGGVNADGVKLIDALIEAGAVDLDDAIDAGFVEGLAGVTLTAVGARKLKVSFNVAVDTTKATIEIKRGTVKPSVKSITWDKDNKSAVVEFNSDLVAGDYTVTVTGLTDEALTATTKVEAAKLTTITFKSDLAVLTTGGVVVNITAANQYGEDMTSKLTSLNPVITTSKGTSPSLAPSGALTIAKGSDEFKVDDKFVVTIVCNTVVASKTLTVAKAAAVESIEFGELTTDNDDLKGKVINVSNIGPDYYLPITVKDQYGNTMTATELNAAIAAGTFQLINSNPKIIKLDTIKELEDGTTVIVLGKVDDDHATHGVVVITAVAAGTGKTASVTLEVKADPKIDVVNLIAPETELKIGVGTVLPLEIIDTYGDEVKLTKDDDSDVVVNTVKEEKDTVTLFSDTTLRATGAEFSKSIDYVSGKLSIKIKPTEKTVVITVTTATGKYQHLTLTAKDAPVATSIKGLKANFATMLANDSSLSTDLKNNVIFLDQYGDVIADTDAPKFSATPAAGKFTVEEKSSGENLPSSVISSSETAGSAKYVIKLYDADSKVVDTYEFTITIVDKDKITSFEVADIDKIYTGPAGETGEPDPDDYSFDFEVYGLVSGKKVVINQNMVQYVSGLAGVQVKDNKAVYEHTETPTDGKDVNGTLTFLVANSKATYTVTKDIVYSDAAPKAQSIVFKKGSQEIKGDVTSAPANSYANDITAVVTDQYGVESTITVKDMVKTNVTTKSVQLHVFVDGLYKTLKVILEPILEP